MKWLLLLAVTPFLREEASFAATPSAPPLSLNFETQPPLSTPTNRVFASQPVVALRDDRGKIVPNSSCVVTLSLNAEGSDSLLGSLSRATVNGVADFANADLRVSTITGGKNFSLTASPSCAGVSEAKSATFAVTLSGTPARLSLSQSPGDSSLNMVWPVQPVVGVFDANGILVSSDNDTVVTVAADAESPEGVILGATSIRVVNGIATFSGLETVRAHGHYRLVFGAAGHKPQSIVPVTAWQTITAH